MKFSVIIPALNEEEHVASAIKSLLQQTIPRKEYEIIVADNNSTDNTSAAAKKAGADKVVIELKKGTNMARNRGYLESQGEIIAFLDADSVAPPDWLARIGRSLENPSISMVSGPYDYGFTGLRSLIDKVWTGIIFPRVPALLEFLFGKKAGIIIEGNFAAPRKTFEAIGGIPLIAFWGDGPAMAIPASRKVGKVLFDPSLRIKSSPRRFGRENIIRLGFLYAKAYLKCYFAASKE